ncbi:hypothetical protein C8R46DRAFT_1227175 [Mycena filopes]|nr:hypothetical protein C8R46DRAFT_1227175 [Mycena filopes]
MSLPTELEREIFEAAALSNLRSIPRLLLVAWRVKIWLEPLLYRSLSIPGYEPHPHSQSSSVRMSPEDCLKLLDSVSQPSPMRHVRHLALTKMDSITLRILSACPGVVRLALFQPSFPSFVAPIAQMRLVRLAADVNKLFPGVGLDSRHSIFAALTHLDLFQLPTSENWAAELCSLPRLTHLSFNHNDLMEFAPLPEIAYILAHCAHLEVLVLIFGTEENRTNFGDCHGFADDPRSVTLVDADYLDDWETGAGGGEDYWARAERFIQTRRSGSPTEGSFLNVGSFVTITLEHFQRLSMLSDPNDPY